MAESAVVVATGADRPGIMDELSQFLLESGGNIADIRTINLHGQFALLMLVRGEAATMELIRGGLVRLQSVGVAAELRSVSLSENASDNTTFPYIFDASGRDQAGVLHRISHLLRVLNINIQDIQTQVDREGGFKMRLAVSVPRETPIAMVRDYLKYLCDDLRISGELKEA